MSTHDLNPFDWYNNFFVKRGSSSARFFEDTFREFDEMRKSISEQFKNIENTVPKDLVKEYETPEGGKVRQVGPIV